LRSISDSRSEQVAKHQQVPVFPWFFTDVASNFFSVVNLYFSCANDELAMKNNTIASILKNLA
jgi:hypothetical protein